jgi:PAS domain S-box-containing protein
VQVSGYLRHEAVGKPAMQLGIWSAPDDRERLLNEFALFREVRNLEANFRCKDGRVLTGLISARPLNLEGEAHLLSITRDITQLKTAQEEKQRLEAQLVQAQKLEAIGTLAGGIAHDFNNILLAVAGNAAIAKLDVAPKSAAMESISEIETATFRAADLTRQLLAYAGSGQLMVRNVEVAELVRDTVKLVRRVSANFVVVEVDAGSDPVYIEGDDVQLRQVVMNLVTNAYDALADSAGRMQVCSGARHFGPEELALVRSGTIVNPGHYAFISVEDDGPGIPPERLSRIFEPFYSTKGAGRGLGLAAVIGIVNAHRGAIMVETEEDQGTTFTVLFPVAASGKTGVESLSR